MKFNKLNFMKILVVIISCISIGYICGKFSNVPNDKNLSNKGLVSQKHEVDNDIPKNKLSIIPKFFETNQLIYSLSKNQETLNSTLELNEIGQQYISTELFDKNYKINIGLINNQSDTVYCTFESLEWNIAEKKNINLILDKTKIENKDILSELNTQLNFVNKGKASSIMYYIEVSSFENPDNIMRTVGMLSKK